MCGEKMMKAGSNCAMLGSPPRMRGKVHCSSARTAAAGITPAYAGKSSEHTQRSGTSGDHPRVCGEKRLMVVMEYAAVGSPPRMRGKARPHPMGTLERRITPAYAGKSPCLPVVLPCCEDHPRVCGEKSSFLSTACSPKGSPPRMRGKARYAVHRHRTHWDHPRVCGEKPDRILWEHWREGSPPRMRGKD